MHFKRHVIWISLLWATVAGAQTSTFTYQGQLVSGTSPLTGLYDLRFTLYDTFNNITNLLDGPVTNAPVPVTNGLFFTTITFSNAVADFNGGARALAIAVRPHGNTGAYVALSPYQGIQSTPYAIQSLNALGLSAPLASTNISGVLPLSDLSSNVALLTSNEIFSGSVAATNFYGSGAGLSNVPSISLKGILPDALLSTNVARLNTNANFLTNVTAVQFNGSGYGLTNVPGAFFWETVNGTVSASSNEGYIVTNGVTPTIITLPASPNPGDTFRVAGVGAGGWVINQNPGQQILAGNLAAVTGLGWTPQTNAGLRNWTGLASSADGTKLAATTYGGDIYVSANSGVTWTNVAGPLDWSSIASSSDGSHLIATVGTASGTTGNVYLSTNFGAIWNVQTTPPATTWVACASSASGSTIVAASYSGDIYFSVNGGTSWLGLVNGPNWTGVACSADGTKIAVCPGAGGNISTSTNSGVVFTPQNGSGLHQWSSIASSADGNHLVATVSGNGGIYASENAGVAWFQVTPNLSVTWTSIASSADGSHLAAAYGSSTIQGYVFTSADSGSTWLQRYGATNADWTAIASSSNGSQLAAAAYGGYIWTSGQVGSTTGTNGYVSGAYQSALELQYVGNGLFLPLSHEGTITAH